jgi:hypothetical protein
VDELRQLITRAYPEVEILADCDGHGRGRELHVRNNRGLQCVIRHEADLFRWFGDRRSRVQPQQPVKQRSLFE